MSLILPVPASESISTPVIPQIFWHNIVKGPVSSFAGKDESEGSSFFFADKDESSLYHMSGVLRVQIQTGIQVRTRLRTGVFCQSVVKE